MSQTAAVAQMEEVASRPSRLAFVAVALALVALVAAIAVVGYPLFITVAIGGAISFLFGLVAVTAADLFGGRGE